MMSLIRVRGAMSSLSNCSRGMMEIMLQETNWRCGNRVRSVSTGDVSAGVQIANGALNLFNEAQKLYKTRNPQQGMPSLMLDVRSPKLGRKKVPASVHPLMYLRSLEELKDYETTKAKLSYMCPEKDEEITISNEFDWLAVFTAPSPPTIVVEYDKFQIWARATKSMSQVSEQLRTYCKTLLAGHDSDEALLQGKLQELKDRGYSRVQGEGYVWEELGYSKEDWPAVVDNMVDQGLPEAFAKSMKLAAKAKRGSNKVHYFQSKELGDRSIYYMKVQVLSDEGDNIDALVALYRFSATETLEAPTNLELEYTLRSYVELDAHRQWKQHVKQMLQ